jgi:hypothetical protein
MATWTRIRPPRAAGGGVISVSIHKVGCAPAAGDRRKPACR